MVYQSNTEESTDLSSPSPTVYCALLWWPGGSESSILILRPRCHADTTKTIVDASRSDTKWHGIFKSTTGMVFFGTPFQGAGGLDQTEIIRAAQSQYAEDQVQATVLNILSPGNESLIDLTTNFFETRQGEGKTHIACFFEQKSSNVGAIFCNGRIQISQRHSDGTQC